jgi:hypothetical protein
MIRVNVICEGQTEESFVGRVLAPHLLTKGIQMTPRNLGKGDNYDKLRYNIVQWMKEESGAYVTTLVDVYGMNDNFPGYQANKNRPPFEKVVAVEAALKADIDREGFDARRFIPHFQLHEFEALLFSKPSILQEWLALYQKIEDNAFQQIRADFETPEHINDNPNTAPSKRIERIAPSFDKVAEGVLIAEDIGLEAIREACPHFDAWISTLEQLPVLQE